jgi:transcriptional regulator GlxA family with amidase domain
MASLEAMSVRNFNRRFREEVGTTPMTWLTQQRVERARELLEESDLPMDQVAARSGLGTAANLRQHFQLVNAEPFNSYRPGSVSVAHHSHDHAAESEFLSLTGWSGAIER